jgi:hypothetical protein
VKILKSDPGRFPVRGRPFINRSAGPKCTVLGPLPAFIRQQILTHELFSQPIDNDIRHFIDHFRVGAA